MNFKKIKLLLTLVTPYLLIIGIMVTSAAALRGAGIFIDSQCISVETCP